MASKGLQGNVTLAEALATFESYLTVELGRMSDKNNIGIAVFTALGTLCAPLVFIKLWKDGKLWLFRLQRKDRGTYIVAHPLVNFALWCGINDMLILIVVCLKFRYEASQDTLAKEIYTYLTLVTWVVVPIVPMYTIIGTVTALPEPNEFRPGWRGKIRKLVSSPWVINGACILSPLVWISVSIPFAVLTRYHYQKGLELLDSLRADYDASTDTSAPLTQAQQITYIDCQRQFTNIPRSNGILSAIWSAAAGMEVICMFIVGSMIVHLLYCQIRELKKGATRQKFSEAEVAIKIHYLRDSIIVLGSFYLLIVVGGTILTIATSVFTSRVLSQQITQSLVALRVCNTMMDWIFAICGLGSMLLLSGRVWAATSPAAVHRTESNPDGNSSSTAAIDTEGDGDNEKRVSKRSAGMRIMRKLGQGHKDKNIPRLTASTIGEGVQVDVEEEFRTDSSDPDLETSYNIRLSPSTPASHQTSLPSLKSSTSPFEEEHALPPPWER